MDENEELKFKYQEIYAATPALALAIVALKARQEAGIAQS